MKHIFVVKYRHGLLGESTVVASDMAEARREAIATCRFFTACIPDGFRFEDIVESIEQAGPNATVGGFGRQSRATVQYKLIKM